MTDTSATITLVLKAKNLASKELGGLKKTFGDLNIGGLALATGIGAVVGGLGFAAKAAIDEQKNIAKLNAALKANVQGWDGNTKSIEAQIAKREDLAFSDDDLRDSLSRLVTSTKDVKQAQDLQTIAMDLARAKGVDLATASIAVAKANAGSTRELKALGIEVDDNASAQENLAKVAKAVSGQASAYAGTMAGKWETFNNKVGDVVEDVGSMLLPIVEKLMDFLLTTGIPAIQNLAGALGPVLGFLGDIASAILGPVLGAFGSLVGAIKGALDWIGGLIGKVREFLGLVDKTERRNLPDITDFRGETRRYNTLTDRGHAIGGSVGAGEWSWVGEQGPELVRFGRSARVYSAGVSRTMGGSGQPVSIPIILDGREIARVVDRHLYYASRGGPSLRGA